MRRRDILMLLFLFGLVGYGWHQLLPPTVDSGDLTISVDTLSALSPWHGPIEKAQAADPVNAADDLTSGSVKGVSTEPLMTPPNSLLPVETYHGSPFIFTLDEMLKAGNITVYPEDIVQAFPDPRLGLGSEIHVYRATPIDVVDWGKKHTYRTWQKTVGDFLDEQNVELGANDRVDHGSKEVLTGQTTLTITRVAITEVTQKEKIAFNKVQKEDPDLPRGQTKVTVGVIGERSKTFRVTRENGVEVKRELIKNEVTKQPQDELTIVGTKVLIGKSVTGISSWYKYDSTKVASDIFRRGTNLRITNLDNGKQIFVRSDGCICSDTNYIVDLHPDYFKQLGGKLSDGLMPHIKVDEILN